MEHFFCVDCSSCGAIYGLFDSFRDAQQHAAASGHDADATDKPARPGRLVHPSRHGADGPLVPPDATCGACGVRAPIMTRQDLAAFEDIHEESCGSDAFINFDGDLEVLPD
jgi:hypothetical protein